MSRNTPPALVRESPLLKHPSLAQNRRICTLKGVKTASHCGPSVKAVTQRSNKLGAQFEFMTVYSAVSTLGTVGAPPTCGSRPRHRL